MKSLIIALVLVMVLSVPAVAFDEWTEKQKDLQFSMTILAAADYITTIYGIQYCGLYESEPLIAGTPTPKEVFNYGLTLYLGHFIISNILPSNWRSIWLGLGNIYLIKCVGNNISLCYKFSF